MNKRKMEQETIPLESQSVLDWSSLPLEPLLRVFSFLDKIDLCSVSQVNYHWREASNKDENWKRLCGNDWRIYEKKFSTKNEETSSSDNDITYKDVYAHHFTKWRRYIGCYSRIRNIYDRLITWLRSNAPEIIDTFNEGATEEQLDQLEALLDTELPEEVRCLYRLFNGQNANTGNKRGLFGGYKFYDYRVNLLFCSISRVLSFYNSIKYSEHDLPPWMTSSISIVQSFNNWKNLFLILKSNDVHSAGMVVELNQELNGTFLVASSFVKLFEDLVDNLESGNYEVSDKGEIIRFPSKFGCESETTKGVKITASPLFVAERSTASPRSYFFAYRIRMTMDKDEPEEHKSKLLTRHWVITQGDNHSEEVSGPGVVGKFPAMYPGAVFEYESCCPLPTRTGKMSGSFQMKLANTGELFDAAVPTYHFVSPQEFEH